ncbi:MAG: hypothetical protein AABX53_00755 [Nanoarchaeota archaeon]
MRGQFKRIGTSILAGIVTSLPFVSAETNFEIFARGLSQGFSGFLSTLKIEPALLTTLLLGILLWIVLYSIVKKVFNYEGTAGSWSAGGVSLIIVFLTFIYVPDNFIEAIALQYSAMGATILTMIPFLILLYFTVVVSDSLFIARVIWIFYTMYYLIIFGYKFAESAAGTSLITLDNLPYFGAIIAGIAIIVLLGVMRDKIFSTKLSSDAERALKGVKVRETSRRIQNEEAESYGLAR